MSHTTMDVFIVLIILTFQGISVRGQSNCDVSAIQACTAQYASNIGTERPTVKVICSAYAAFQTCLEPHKAACINNTMYRQFQDAQASIAQQCEVINRACDVNAIASCLSTYSSEVRTVLTRGRTCRLVADLRECMRPHLETCQEHQVYQSFLDTMDATEDTCGDVTSEETSCDQAAITSCMRTYRSAVRIAPTRSRTCRLVADLRDCMRSHSETCQEHRVYQSYLSTMDATQDTCGDVTSEETSCDQAAITLCMRTYRSAVRTAPTRSRTCRLVADLRDCMRPHSETCQEHRLYQSYLSTVDATQDTCGDSGSSSGSECDSNAARLCMSQYRTTTRSDDQTRATTCRAFAVLSDCLRQLERPCRRHIVLKKFEKLKDSMAEICTDVGRSVTSCLDWNNTVIEHDEMFSPHREEPCHRCTCINGEARYCKDVACVPPDCEGAVPVAGVCCQFVCPNEQQTTPIDLEESVSSCLDWNNTEIEHDEMFSPHRGEPCHRCTCINGEARYCKDVACVPPDCEGAVPVMGVCCEFVCPDQQQTTAINLEELECQDGWTRHGNKCYFVSRDRFNWINAQMVCKTINGKLVEIVSEDENEFVKNFAMDSGVGNFWIGVTDLEVDGTFKFPEGVTAINFHDWGRRALPMSKTMNCVEMRGRGRRLNWRPTNCRKKINFVCQRKLM